MTAEILVFSLASLMAVPIVWVLPSAYAWNGLAIWTALVLATVSPFSALWLVGSAVMTPLVMRFGDHARLRGLVTIGWATILVSALLSSRFFCGTAFWIGGAYFTLRNLHGLFDWWMGRLAIPALGRHLRYQLFLPVLVAGPINRVQHFERQCDRRRWDSSAFFSGAERALFGLAQAVVFGDGGWLAGEVNVEVFWITTRWWAFWREWAVSAVDWVQLYFTFAGLSSLALGLALMMGLRLEENFNRPWAARNLVEFWTRWHMTLSFWCRDYVFQPVTALSRSPLIGLMAAMAAIALWHEVSAYYMLWAVWQVSGIILTRSAQTVAARYPARRLPPATPRFLGPLFVLGWLSLAKPVLHRVLEFAN